VPQVGWPEECPMTQTHGDKSTTSNLFFRHLVKQFIPPMALSALRRLLSKNTEHINYIGCQSWKDAEEKSTGYDAEEIMVAVRNAAKLVLDGKAVYERDSLIFDKIQYSWPLLASLLFAAANSQKMRVIDFGGGLGTTFQQNRRFLTRLENNCEWRIVEQKAFVEIGRKEFTTQNISFFDTISEAAKNGVDIVLFCGSLCYVENPYCFLDEAINSCAPYIIFDRTPITDAEKDIFAVENHPPSIYKASYPIRNFNYSNLLNPLKQSYELVEEWICDLQPDKDTTAMGFLFKRKTN
jgi:putative methyltransferase (TIGR04325 family)